MALRRVYRLADGRLTGGARASSVSVFRSGVRPTNCGEVNPVTRSVTLSAVLLGLLILASSCETVSYSSGDGTERITWREYLDC